MSFLESMHQYPDGRHHHRSIVPEKGSLPIPIFYRGLQPWMDYSRGSQFQSSRPPHSAYFACLSLLTHLIQIISLLDVCSMHELCSDWHAPYTGSIAPYSLSRGNPLKFTSLRNIHSWICAAQRLHARMSVASFYTSVNIYNFNSRLAHFNALWMEYIRSLRTGIMAEYPVMSTSQGTYVRIEQTSEAIRVTYEICRAGGGLGLRLGREDWNWEPLDYRKRL